jgi:riboflavin synthase
VTRAGRSIELSVTLPPELARYVARKGSIAIDGVSLTVNAVSAAQLTVNIVPHTAAATIIGDYRPGTAVNMEVDIIARYLERLSESGRPLRSADPNSEPGPERGVTLELLRQHGYASND